MDQMLSQMTPEQFDERFAAWLVDGRGSMRETAASLVAEIRNLIPAYAQTKTERKISDRCYTTADDVLPPLFRVKQRRKGMVYASDPDAAQRVAKGLGIS